MDTVTSEDSETEYCTYSDINIRNDTKQKWQLDSCHAISFYLPQLLTKSRNNRNNSTFTPQNACLFEKYASTASFITKSNRIIKSLPQEEQRAAKQKLLDDVKTMNMSISDTDKAIVNSISGDVTDEYYITTLPSEVLTYSKKGKSYSYSMTYDEYKDYVTDYINAVNQKRQEQISTDEYINADTDDKIEMLKNAKSDAGKEVRGNYIDRLSEKFIQTNE